MTIHCFIGLKREGMLLVYDTVICWLAKLPYIVNANGLSKYIHQHSFLSEFPSLRSWRSNKSVYYDHPKWGGDRTFLTISSRAEIRLFSNEKFCDLGRVLIKNQPFQNERRQQQIDNALIISMYLDLYICLSLMYKLWCGVLMAQYDRDYMLMEPPSKFFLSCLLTFPRDLWHGT